MTKINNYFLYFHSFTWCFRLKQKVSYIFYAWLLNGKRKEFEFQYAFSFFCKVL